MIYYKVCRNIYGKYYSLTVADKPYCVSYKLNEISVAPQGGLCVFDSLVNLRNAMPWLTSYTMIAYFECECEHEIDLLAYPRNDLLIHDSAEEKLWPKGTKLFKTVKPIKELTKYDVWSDYFTYNI